MDGTGPRPGIQLSSYPLAPGYTPMPATIPQMPVEGEEVLDTNQPFEGKTVEQIREEETQFELDVQYKLSVEEKQAIAEHIIKLVDMCENEREEWREIRKESLDLLWGVRPPKSDPWPNCSNITTMSVATHCKLMHSKLLPAVWNENLINWRPVEKGDVNNVEKVKKFMNWVVRQDMKMQTMVDDIIWDWITNGTVALKTRWVTEYRMVSTKDIDGKVSYKEVPRQRCIVDNIPIDEVYLPTLWQGVDNSEFIAQDIYMRLSEIEDLADRKIYQVDDITNKIIPNLDEMVPDSLRKKKIENEGTTGENIGKFKESLPVRLIECYLKWSIAGEIKESVFVIAYHSGAYLSGKPLSAVSPIGKRPFVIDQFMRRTGRPYGISLPEEMRGLAKELDAIHNQRIDAGTISIAPFGFYRAASSFRPEIVQIGPGSMIPVDDIKDVNMVQLQHNPIASFQEERVIIEYMEKLTATSAYQMGRESDIVKSRATASATLAIISQGEQSFTLLGVRCQNMMSELVTKILQQYQMFMPEGYADRVLGEKPGELLFPTGLGKLDIAGEYDAYMTLDATAGNKQMEKQANLAMVQMGPTLMALAQDPRGYEMAKDFIQSLGKVDVEKYIGPKPKKQPTSIPIGAGMGGVMPQGGGGGGMGGPG